jgi:hypothetical protein
MFAGEGSYFAAIPANGHRAPAAAARARIVVKEQTTLGIGAKPKARTGSLGDDLRPGSGHRREQPIEASFSGDKFHFPDAILADKFIMAFGDAQDFVYRIDPFSSDSLLSEHGRENLPQGGAEPPGFQEQCFRGLGVGLRQAQKLGTALSGDDARGLQKVDKLFPGQFRVWWSRIDKIDGEPPAEEWQA